MRLKNGKILLLLIICMAMLGGCSQSRQVENQAYVIVLGVDTNEAGEIVLNAKIPTLSASGSEDEPSAQDSYQVFSASGRNFDTALQTLHRASPRNLNLSQMQLLVVSETLAKQIQFREIIEQIAQTERLFTASYVVISEGDAGEFVDALEPAVGSRLSLDIPAILENYAEQGLIPDATLADLYYLSETMYSDPMAISAHPSNSEPETYTETVFSGAKVFRNGQLSMELDAEECVLSALLRNEADYFRYEVDGKSIEAAPNAPTKLSVELKGTTAALCAELYLNIGIQNDMPDIERIQAQMEAEILELIAKAQQNNVEPFGFSNIAAGKYITIQKWLDSDWRSSYQNADVEVRVHIALRDA